ncbi:MAG TPA: metal ABC transporter permease, partial [Pirellulales bacterium]|nr:metal ABC transporter permease [Pirellulales bacterium]
MNDWPDWLLWPDYNTRVVLAGTSLLGASSGLVGCFAVLRRRALMGDALAHATLPGVALAFLVWGERSLPVLLFGALVTGVMGVAVVAMLRFATRTKEDAAIGIVLGVASAIGFVLLRWIQSHSSSGSKAGLDSYILGKTAGMIASDVYLIAGVSGACLVVLLLLYKEFKAIAFDPGFARAQGWPSLTLDFLLTGLIALAVVVGLPAVGGLLITALLIVPAVSARFWTDGLGRMLTVSSIFGAVVAASGTALSSRYEFSPAGPVIILVAASLFVVSMLLAPRRGVVARVLAVAQFRRRLARQKLLRTIALLAEEMRASDLSITIEQLDGGRRNRRSGAAFRSLILYGLLKPA